MFENRRYMILNVSEIGSVDFNEILESSQQRLRKSVDGTKTFVKWDITGDEFVPASIDALSTKEGPYTHAQIKSILSTSAWTEPETEENV